MRASVVMHHHIAAKPCFEFIAQSPYSACQATAAMKQAFAECIIKSQCLFRADNIRPYDGIVKYKRIFNTAVPCRKRHKTENKNGDRVRPPFFLFFILANAAVQAIFARVMLSLCFVRAYLYQSAGNPLC